MFYFLPATNVVRILIDSVWKEQGKNQTNQFTSSIIDNKHELPIRLSCCSHTLERSYFIERENTYVYLCAWKISFCFIRHIAPFLHKMKYSHSKNEEKDQHSDEIYGKLSQHPLQSLSQKPSIALHPYYFPDKLKLLMQNLNESNFPKVIRKAWSAEAHPRSMRCQISVVEC